MNNYQLCCDEPQNYIMLADIPSESINNELLQYIWNNRQAQYCSAYTLSTASIYIDALVRGWKGDNALTLAYETTAGVNIAYNSPDWKTVAMMEANLFRFSAARSLDAVNQLNQLLPESKTFADFKKKAESVINDKFNLNYLRTEYNFAYRTSQMAADYHRLIAMKDIYPSWEYKTQGDSRVREAHRRLDGMIFKAGDFNAIWPPNGWGCRCYIKPLQSVPEKYNTEKEAITELQSSNVDKNGQSEWDRMVKGHFNINRATQNVIFTENQFYAKLMDSKLGIKDNNVMPYPKIDQQKNPVYNMPDNKDRTNEWFNSNVNEQGEAVFYDYNKKPVILTKEQFDSHINKAKEGEIPRYNLINAIPDIIKDPDEVYLNKDGSDYIYRYIKFYKDLPLNVVLKLNTEHGFIIQSWYDIRIKEIDMNKRTGILIHKKN